ncbi:MAG TPA: methyltransferase domain-containing protein [Balneolaceae bacterium]|nr:methyltransferase domain-containing protein [Balneolaceae bacterium]
MYKQHFDETYGAKGPENYDRFFVPAIGRPLAEELVERANLQSGQTVLDVACGTGIVALLASQKVGGEGSVSGLDPNPGMLAVVRSLGQSIEWYEASAEAIPLPDNTFDVVFCQMGLQFIEDKVVALKEMRRVLAPGGRLLLNVPGPAAKPFSIMADAMKKYISEQAAGFVSHVFSLHDPDQIKQLADRAGFSDIRAVPHKKELRLPKAEEFLWQYVYSTPLAAVVSEAGETAHTALERDLIKRWQGFAQNGSLVYTQPMVTLAAQK